MKPAQRENAGYAHAAEVLAAIPGVAAAPVEIERRLKLPLPFVVVVIAEIGTIAFLNIGLGHVRRPVVAPVARAASTGRSPDGSGGSKPAGSRRGAKCGSSANIVAFPGPRARGAKRLQQAEDALLSHLRQHGSAEALGGSNRAIAEALGFDRTTLARAAASLSRKGVIAVEAHKNGTRFTLKRSA
jgi:hypothetical protein